MAFCLRNISLRGISNSIKKKPSGLRVTFANTSRASKELSKRTASSHRKRVQTAAKIDGMESYPIYTKTPPTPPAASLFYNKDLVFHRSKKFTLTRPVAGTHNKSRIRAVALSPRKYFFEDGPPGFILTLTMCFRFPS